MNTPVPILWDRWTSPLEPTPLLLSLVDQYVPSRIARAFEVSAGTRTQRHLGTLLRLADEVWASEIVVTPAMRESWPDVHWCEGKLPDVLAVEKPFDFIFSSRVFHVVRDPRSCGIALQRALMPSTGIAIISLRATSESVETTTKLSVYGKQDLRCDTYYGELCQNVFPLEVLENVPYFEDDSWDGVTRPQQYRALVLRNR